VKPLPAGYVPSLTDDSHRRVLFCPESGWLLTRYQVGHSLHFHIDRSPVTGGVWLDKGEWEALKSKNLHTELNLIFTASYQKHVRSGEFEESLEHSFRDRIGEADFQKVADFKKWLDAHPKSRDIQCYLQHQAEPAAGK
jgi:Zn-finger nucleic acid-binding protein